MKKLLVFLYSSLFVSLFLISCGPTQKELAATATWQVYNQQVATVIAGTRQAKAALPTNTPTPTPPPLALDAALLTQDEVFSVLTWEREVNVDDYPNADTFNFYSFYDFCDYNCIDRYWVNGDWESYLGILLSRYPTELTALETFDRYFQPDPAAKPATEYTSLSSYTLPQNSLVYEYTDGMVQVGSQGRVIFVVILRAPTITSEQQLYYLGEFAQKQLIKLIAFGN
ncbi:MAG: hypothetical protein H6636_01050 [Anaerolineales bacterium]|nr:hypothetical protein [Anaerolineales bacterium]